MILCSASHTVVFDFYDLMIIIQREKDIILDDNQIIFIIIK